MSSISLHSGTIFADRYRILRCIAVGGMGAVYEVTHIETDRRRALKVMHPHCLQDEEMRQRFRMEARVAAAVETEHVVDVSDAGVDPATQMLFMVMELLRGEDLARLLRERTRFGPLETITYLRQVASALDKTHEASIVHRDLKPENIFLTSREDGSPWIKVLDFGIAKVLAEDGSRMKATTGVGTPLYMAPEQFLPDLEISCATDLYALGMVAYTLLVGLPYWREESRRSEGNVYAFAREVIEGPIEAATTRARRAGVELPDAFDAWFAKATAYSPSRRFQRAGDMVAALAVALDAPPAGLDTMATARAHVVASRAETHDPASLTAPGSGSTEPPISRSVRRLFLGVAALGITALGALGAALLGRASASTAQNGAPGGAMADAEPPTSPAPAPPEASAPAHEALEQAPSARASSGVQPAPLAAPSVIHDRKRAPETAAPAPRSSAAPPGAAETSVAPPAAPLSAAPPAARFTDEDLTND